MLGHKQRRSHHADLAREDESTIKAGLQQDLTIAGTRTQRKPHSKPNLPHESCNAAIRPSEWPKQEDVNRGCIHQREEGDCL